MGGTTRLVSLAALLGLVMTTVAAISQPAGVAAGDNDVIQYPFGGGKNWKIVTGYNKHKHQGHQRFSLDFTTKSGSPVGEPVLAPVTGNVSWLQPRNGNWDARSPNCVAIRIAKYSSYYLMLCHIEFNDQVKKGNIRKGQRLGVVGRKDTASSEPHIHMTLYHAKSPGGTRTPIPFSDPWRVSGCSYPNDGTANQYRGTSGLPKSCSTRDHTRDGCARKQPGPYEVLIFRHIDYKGVCYSIRLGNRDQVGDGWLGNNRIGNDAVSSIKVGQKVDAALFEHSAFNGGGGRYGRVEIFWSGEKDRTLKNNWIGNDETSSIRIWARSERVTAASDASGEQGQAR